MKIATLKVLNGFCFVVIVLAGIGSLNKSAGYAPDSLLYQSSLLLLSGAFLLNYWSLQQTVSKTLASTSDIFNVAACTLFLVGISDKPIRGGLDIVLLIGVLLPAALTPLYLHQVLCATKAEK